MVAPRGQQEEALGRRFGSEFIPTAAAARGGVVITRPNHAGTGRAAVSTRARMMLAFACFLDRSCSRCRSRLPRWLLLAFGACFQFLSGSISSLCVLIILIRSSCSSFAALYAFLPSYSYRSIFRSDLCRSVRTKNSRNWFRSGDSDSIRGLSFLASVEWTYTYT